jgi:hypothetical protein
MPLGDRHVVNRSLFDHQVAEFGRHACTYVLNPDENTNTCPPPRRATCYSLTTPLTLSQIVNI